MTQFGMPVLIENETLEQNARMCASMGLRFLELNMSFPEYQIECIEETDDLLRTAERAGIYYTIHLDENLDIAGFGRLVTAAWLQTVRRTIAAAKKLLPLRDAFGGGGQPMVLNMHVLHGIYVTLPDRKVRLYERGFDAYMKAYARFRILCEDWIGGSPIVITVENTDGFSECEKEAVSHLLESPVFGLNWDIGHSCAAGEGDQPFILAHREKLRHFHIHDGSANPKRDHLALGDGEIDLMNRLGLARETGARCVLEIKTSESLKKSLL